MNTYTDEFIEKVYLINDIGKLYDIYLTEDCMINKDKIINGIVIKQNIHLFIEQNLFDDVIQVGEDMYLYGKYICKTYEFYNERTSRRILIKKALRDTMKPRPDIFKGRMDT